MALTPGTMLGPYCIEETLGAGGMGEVYRALDTRLDRRVAVKVLATQFAASEAMRQRFDQEARTISSLSHPGICQLYDIGHEQGLDYLVMEFLDGLTLAERIDKGPLSTKELLKMAIDVADALEAAHASGVIHRDLKPANIMLSSHGAKLMDFGLAKLAREPELLAQTVAVNEASAAQLTSPGSAVGTVAYMSPEQARGETLDSRSDLFSFGAVMYEAVSGKRAFAGKTSAVVFHAILEKSPEPLHEVAPHVPPALADIIDRLLEKDPEMRPQSAGEVRATLKRLQRDLSDPSGQLRSGFALEREARRKRVTKIGLIAGMVAVLTALAVIFLRPGSTTSMPGSKIVASATSPEQLTQLGNVLDGAAISPDGKYVAYVTDDGPSRTVWVRQVAVNSAVAIVKNEVADAGFVTFSNDGQYVYYLHATNPREYTADLYAVLVLGGDPRKIVANVMSPVAVSRTGQLAFQRFEGSKGFGLYIADSDGKSERRVESVSLVFTNPRPAWSPDGRKLAVGARQLEHDWHVAVIDLETGGVERIANIHWDFVGSVGWMPDGKSLIVIGASSTFRNQIWQLDYPGGEARQITNDLNNYGDTSITLPDDGSAILSVQNTARSMIWEGAAMSRSFRKLTSGTSMDGIGGVSVAPDGSIYYGTNLLNGIEIVQLTPMSEKKQITRAREPGEMSFYPSMSPDGRTLVRFSQNKRGPVIVASEADGGNPRNLPIDFEPLIVQDPLSFSRDSKFIYFTSLDPKHMGIWQVAVDGNSPPKLVRGGAYLAPALSPDGKTMKVGKYDETTRQYRDEIFPMGSDREGTEIAIGPGHPVLVQWTPDGKALSFIGQEDGLYNVYMQPIAGGKPRQLTFFDSDEIFHYGWKGKGRLVVARGPQTADVVLIRGLQTKAVR